MIRFDVDVCTFLLCCALHFVFREYYGLTWLDLTWLDLFRIRYFHCNNISLSIERQEVLLGWINCHVGTIFELFANKYGMHSFKCMFSFAIHFHIRFTFTSIYIYVYLWLCLFHLLTFNDMIPFTFTHSLTMIHFVFCVLCFILCFILCFFVSHRNTAAMRRFASTVHPAKRSGEGSFKENWLSDAGAYPIVVVISFAMVLCGGVGSRCLMANPDVRVLPSKRNSVIRTWDN